MNVYYFDNTVYKGDSTFDFYVFCLKRHKEIKRLFPSLTRDFLRWKLKKTDKTEFKQSMFAFLKYIDLKKDLKDFWKIHTKNIKLWYYIKHRDDDVIISASPRFLLEPVCEILGVKYLICSEVDPNTGEYTGKNCSEEEKVRRFKEIFPNGTIDEFYSDSKNDMPLVLLAKRSNRIKGDKFLSWK